MRLFDGLNDRQIEAVRPCASYMESDSGGHLFRAGEKSDGFYCINGGVLAVEAKGADGAPRLVGRVSGPTILGEIGFFAGKPRSASVRAESRVSYLQFAGNEFNRLEINDPRAAAEVAHAALKLAVMQFIQREQSIIDAELLNEPA